MAEISIVNSEVQLELALNTEESKAFMDLFNYLSCNNEVFEFTGEDTYKVLNDIYMGKVGKC